MNQPPVDPERLAALLDGRLEGAERARVLAELAHADPPVLAAFADAAVAVQVEREHGDDVTAASLAPRVDAPAAPARARASAQSLALWGLPLLAAAALALMVLRPRSSLPEALRTMDPLVYAARIAGRPTFTETTAPPWPVRRGADDAPDAAARAVRLGVALTDLAVAVRTADAAVPTLASDAARLLDGVPGSAAIATAFRHLGDSTLVAVGDRPRRLAVLARSAALAAGDSDVALGAWLGAVRRACQLGDSASLAQLGLAPPVSAAARARAGASIDRVVSRVQQTGVARASSVATADSALVALAP